MAGYIRQLSIKCPKCRTNKEIVANEVVEAFTITWQESPLLQLWDELPQKKNN